ncbi:Holliday junction branch migration protein RuvA [Rhabdothermincola salaria]|uniref:Holliday junction branch migration protein RuvA n=1 Tax=Rhabdothermincola salaria TaxID=2903142 RepID=UPI001E4BF05B|nr:Holliday junction branch migration protein RuvA [Rhabdothermincola salaria]
MIGSLRGTLLERWPSGEILVEVAGVGYRLTVSAATALDVGELGTEVFVYVHHHRREDVETLYGFCRGEERLAFEALLGAHGVGPSLALAILSVHPPAALQRVLASDDLAALCLVPGVGKKTAARLLVELKSRLEIPGLDTAATAATDTGAPAATAASPHADVRDALANLGYGNEEVAGVLRELPDDGDDSAELLRLALQKLAVA